MGNHLSTDNQQDSASTRNRPRSFVRLYLRERGKQQTHKYDMSTDRKKQKARQEI